MSINSRRNWIKKNIALSAAGLSLPLLSSCETEISNAGQNKYYDLLDDVLKKSILKIEVLDNPVLIQSVELLRYHNNFICRVRSEDGAEGLSVSNNAQMRSLYPIFINRIQNFFIGKDARNLEQLLDEVYVHQSNYKLQNLAFWVPMATLEFAILDLLGKLSGKSMGQLFGPVQNPRVAVYRANNYRGKTAKESIDFIRKNVEEANAKALKIKVGGRMSNREYPSGRTEKLIPLVRKTFGDDMTIYADSNGSYTVDEAIRIGKIMEEYQLDFYEEPVPFDWYEETKLVADALSVPIAGGEQEPSLHGFRWLIANKALQIVQPDIFYFGGMIRSMKVALMADAVGLSCIPHISGSGLGYLYMMHFVSAIPNAGPFHEFKGFNKTLPIECSTSDLQSAGGVIKVPTGPGTGIEIDPDFVEKHQLLKA